AHGRAHPHHGEARRAVKRSRKALKIRRNRPLTGLVQAHMPRKRIIRGAPARRALARSESGQIPIAPGLIALAAGGLAVAAPARLLRRTPDAQAHWSQPNRHTTLAQLDGTPERHYYTGRNLERAAAIGDLRAMTHRRLPKFALEYLEGGAEDEATMLREREAF